jgi:hypothetical protein
MLNDEIIRRLAHGDKEAVEEVKKLPIPLKMAYGAAADELRRKENIVPMSNGMELFVQQKVNPVEREAVGEALRQHLDKLKENEERMEKARKEHTEKVAKQQAERARALGSWA